MTDGPTVELYRGNGLTFLVRGLDRIETDIREIRGDINDLKSTVALKGDMYKILGLMVLVATGTAGVAAFILGIAT